jgi:cell division protein FtsW
MDNVLIKRLNWRPGGDRVLWTIVVILAIVSLLVVYSSTGASVYRTSGADGSHFGIFIRQFFIVLMGLVVVYAVHKVNYQLYGRVVWAAYTLALIFTIMVYFVGEASDLADKAPRWIRIPIINFTFQPSDFLKVATVMVVARELARRQKTIDRLPLFPPLSPAGWKAENGYKILKETSMPLLLPIALSCAVIFPTNLSTALILFGTCFVMLFIGRVRIKELGKLVLVLVLLAGLGTGFLYAIGKPPARMETWVNRVAAFVGHGEKADDADYNYQIEQAKIAIASGGISGRGAGESIQRENLPLSESDYAFAFLVEEYGAIGGLVVLLLYLWIFFRAILIFRKCGTAFPSMLVLGLGLLITLQAIANMMVSTNLAPSTGLTLPLISQGGSSELFLSLALGMMLGVSRQVEEQTLDKPKAESLLEN